MGAGKRGGARPGAGRPPLDLGRGLVAKTFRQPAGIWAEFQRQAKEAKQGQAEYLRSLIRAGTKRHPGRLP